MRNFILDNDGRYICELFDTSHTFTGNLVSLECEHKNLSSDWLFVDSAWQHVPLDRSLGYTTLRRMSYPPIEELADAMYWQNMGDLRPMQKYVAACDAVKKKFAKDNTLPVTPNAMRDMDVADKKPS